MVDAHIGWIGTVIIGGMAGWIGSRLMKAETGIFLNIILGIIGSCLAAYLLGMVGVSFAGRLGYFTAGVVGASLMIGGMRVLRR